MSETGGLPVDTKVWPAARYLDYYKQSIKNPEALWSEIGRRLTWRKGWDNVLSWNYPFAKWFVGGELNASENALDKHSSTWRRNKAAYLWEGEPGDRRTITYQELLRSTNQFASALQKLGVGKGDTVALYLPLVPEFPVAMLASARLGAPFTAVFSGFSSKSLAERIDDCKARIVVTADGGYRRGKIVGLKTVVDEAVRNSRSVEHVVVLRRTGQEAPMQSGRDLWWHEVISNSSTNVPPTPVESNHPLYILYTS